MFPNLWFSFVLASWIINEFEKYSIVYESVYKKKIM